MQKDILANMNKKETVFSTPWFQIVSKYTGSASPYYVLEARDCVTILCVSDEKEVLLVKQYRPTLDQETIELPSGHIEDNETPEMAARRELLEETGYYADDLELMGVIATDTGRLGNKLWCYFASNAVRRSNVSDKEVIELIKWKPEFLMEQIKDGKIIHAQDLALLFLAAQRGKFIINAKG